VLQIRIRNDPYHFSGSGSVPRVSRIRTGSISYSSEQNKINWKRKFYKEYLLCRFCWSKVTDRENQVKMSKNNCFRYITPYYYLLLLIRVRIRIYIKHSDPDSYKIEKQDPDPDSYQSEKLDQDPDPYQKGLDPQHC
jgi:hypothetical protein